MQGVKDSAKHRKNAKCTLALMICVINVVKYIPKKATIQIIEIDLVFKMIHLLLQILIL